MRVFMRRITSVNHMIMYLAVMAIGFIMYAA